MKIMNEKEIKAIGKIVPKNDRVFKKIFGSIGSEERPYAYGY